MKPASARSSAATPARGRRKRTQLCLMIRGPVTRTTRTVHGGWYLPPKAEDLRAYRYGCFGPLKSGCARES